MMVPGEAQGVGDGMGVMVGESGVLVGAGGVCVAVGGVTAVAVEVGGS